MGNQTISREIYNRREDGNVVKKIKNGKQVGALLGKEIRAFQIRRLSRDLSEGSQPTGLLFEGRRFHAGGSRGQHRASSVVGGTARRSAYLKEKAHLQLLTSILLCKAMNLHSAATSTSEDGQSDSNELLLPHL